MQMLPLCRALEKWYLNLCVLPLSLSASSAIIRTKRAFQLMIEDRQSSYVSGD